MIGMIGFLGMSIALPATLCIAGLVVVQVINHFKELSEESDRQVKSRRENRKERFGF